MQFFSYKMHTLPTMNKSKGHLLTWQICQDSRNDHSCGKVVLGKEENIKIDAILSFQKFIKTSLSAKQVQIKKKKNKTSMMDNPNIKIPKLGNIASYHVICTMEKCIVVGCRIHYSIKKYLYTIKRADHTVNNTNSVSIAQLYVHMTTW